ncbi:MAG TPA: flagellar assembly peptidoglycan hydrolase FlgJ [Burkholderiaceae bacterium]|nr:flagellar assembly peptidoglycan hydrolase FlgJ [Burkholderiaceae bacterium]
MAGVSRLAGSADLASLDTLRDPSAAALKARASSDPKATIKAAAKQFEALFMQQLMKSMREATMSSGLLDNGGTQLGTELLDTQYANRMTGLPGGLSDMIARQLERQMSGTGAANVSAAIAPASAAGSPSASGTGAANPTPTQAEFINKHAAAAQAAQAQSGIPAAFMVAQAAHESGWGKSEIRNADGSTSYNLFGIKAGANWKGATTTITTTEVVDGEPRKVQAKFRAYGSYEESFRDYAQLMKDNPRYAAVMNATTADGFAKGLQRAGYATDPGYADKLTRVINTTLRVQRAASTTAKTPENLA